MKHRWELYKETFNKKRIRLLLILLALLAIFHAIILPGIISFVKAVFNPLDDEDTFATLCIVAFFLYASYKAFEQIYDKKNWPSLTSIAIFLSIGLYYWVCYRSDPTWVFFKLFSTDIYLADLILVSLFLLTTDFVHLQPPLKEGPRALFPDDPSKVENDLLGRDQYIEKVGNAIRDTVADRAIGISILAEWGFGKTVFMNLLAKQLRKNSDTIIIHFNPWLGERDQSTIKYFFEELENALQEYDSSATRKISQYTNDLLKPVEEDNLWTKLAKTGTSFIFPGETTIQEKKEAINKIISRIGKRIVVLLDDLDRLTGEELSDVMRLIRNTADFKRTFFVAALDRNYVLNALKESNMVESRDRYLEKIFQLEIVLPPIRKNVVLEELLKAFQNIIENEKKAKEGKNEIPTSELEEVIKDLWDDEITHGITHLIAGTLPNFILDQFITNIRDVYRFANSFRIIYEMIIESVRGDESALKEFFLLELIKFKAPGLYNLFANKSIYKRPKNVQRVWELDDLKVKEILNENSKIADSLSIAKNDRTALKQVVEMLFPSAGSHPKPTSVRIEENHPVYFNYSNRFQVFGLINQLDKGFEAMKEFIDDIANKDGTPHKKDIETFIQTMDGMKDTQPPVRYQLMLKSLLYCNKYIAFHTLHPYILYYFSKNNLNSVYGSRANILSYESKVNLEKFNKFLVEDLFVAEDLSIKTRFETASIISIEGFRGNTPAGLLSREQFSDIAHNLYIRYYREIPESKEKQADMYDMLLGNWAVRDEDTNVVTLNTEACQIYRNYLNEHYEVYVQRLLRPYVVPVKGNWLYTFDPFIRQIFGDYSEFRKFLFALPSTPCVEYNKEKFEDFENNGYNPIYIRDFNEKSPCRQQEGDLGTE